MESINKKEMKQVPAETDPDRRTKSICIFLIIFSSMLGIFISDIYVPSLPSIQVDLGTSKHLLELSVAVYFIFFSLVQLVYGPLSEKFGRKAVFVSGLSISLIGCVVTLTSTHVMQLLIGRAIEAIGMGGPMSLGRVITRDLIKDDIQYAKVSAYISTAILFAPVIAPLFGAYLAHIWNWRADFIFILILNFICLVLAVTKLGETIESKVSKLSLKMTAKTYLSIWRKSGFRRNVITSSLVMGAMLSYLSLSSFLFQKELHLSAIAYSWTFAFGDIFIAIGMLSSAFFVKRVGIEKTLQLGLLLFLLSAIGLLTQLLLPLMVVGVLLPIILFTYSAGILFPTSATAAVLAFKHNIGPVGGLFGCLEMLIAGGISALSTQARLPAIETLVIVFMLTAVISMINNRGGARSLENQQVREGVS